MQVPKAMQKIAKNLHQDVFLLETTLDGIVGYAVSRLSEQEKVEAREYLERLLDGAVDVMQVRNVWMSLPKEIRIEDDQGLVEFLRALKSRLAT